MIAILKEIPEQFLKQFSIESFSSFGFPFSRFFQHTRLIRVKLFVELTIKYGENEFKNITFLFILNTFFKRS